MEVQYASPALGAMVLPGASAPLGRTYKLGAWYDSERFGDERLDDRGGLLVSPTSDGQARTYRGQYSVYAVADQMLWRQEDDPNRSVSVFARAMGSPQADRSFLTFSANLGVVYHDPLANRPDDTLAVGLGYAKVSPRVTAADLDAAAVAQSGDPTTYSPARRDETYVEATYQYQLRPWWQIQPDFQYTFDPGGGVANPINPQLRVKNEAVAGVRTNVLF